MRKSPLHFGCAVGGDCEGSCAEGYSQDCISQYRYYYDLPETVEERKKLGRKKKKVYVKERRSN